MMQRFDARLVSDVCGNKDLVMRESHDGLFVRYEDMQERIAQLTAENDALDADLRECNRAINQIAAERDLARKQVTVVQAALDSTDLARNKFLNERDAALRECERLKDDAHNLKSPVHAICNQNLTEALAAAIEQTQTINRREAPVSDEEWGKGRHLANRSHVNDIIANRAKQEKP